ncbi:ATP-binding cassette domain-containing protein [Streptomyces sp. NRRL F-5650]|uniref:ABC transporter ATP-binding protein n=1 Tax=Streptomyces sp. NRRL F-5650 TaxID=1463868 RepID=UPI0004C675D6|nr:ABC transporter ATP-binding protein [Streptomyces sp. NRRL F-5650]
MIQAFGLTSNPRKELLPAVDDVSFEACAGRVTALLGASGAGKTTALRLMLELQRGRGLTYFRGRPLHRIAHPAREVGVLLGDVPGHPARTVRGHLRMLCAAAGVPVRRADEVLESAGLESLRDERLGALSRGMDRRLGLACALVPDPHTLVCDDPAGALCAQDARWLHGALRAHAAQGGTVLFSTPDPKEAARNADHVVTLEKGRVVADQEAAEFSRTRLRPRVAVRTPHAARLAALVAKEARTARRSVEVVPEGGNRLAVYGSTCADIGETAFRNGILVHQLADEVGDMGPGAGAVPAARNQERGETDGDRAQVAGTQAAGAPAPPRTAPSGAPRHPHAGLRQTSATEGGADTTAAETVRHRTPGPRRALAPEGVAHSASEGPGSGPGDAPDASDAPDVSRHRASRPFGARLAGSVRGVRDEAVTLPPPIVVRSSPSPLRPLRYELRRALGVGTGFVIGAVVLLVSTVTAVILARIGHTPQARLLAAWPQQMPLPPAALGAGLLGALAFGDEFRHPALAADRGTVPRRMGLLTAKLVVSAATALLLAALTVGCDTEVLRLFYGAELVQVPTDWPALSAGWLALVVGCAWSGVLAAGVFRSTSAGLAAVVAVPVVVVPLVQKVWQGPSVRTAAGLPMRVRESLLTQWPFGGERYVAEALRLVAQPVGGAMTLSLTTLLCAYLLTTLRGRVR